MKLRILLSAALVALFASLALAQDPVKVDPKHYKVETENAQVRVLRVNYGPHEKSVMHSHPATVAVFLTDGSVRFTDPSGKVENMQVKKGQAMYGPPGIHDPENLADAPFELILVELKGRPAAAKK